MKKVYIDNNAKLYAAENSKSENDALFNLPPEEWLRNLDNEPITKTELDERIRQEQFEPKADPQVKK